ncbi:MAG: hypothetical protein ABI665_16050 [Vicinamibacterales bacterium]
MGFVLVFVLPATGIVAGILAWFTFREPVLKWPAVGIAVAILAIPYVMAAIIEPRGGLDLAFSSNPLAMISKLVAIGIVIATITRLVSKRA